MISVGNITVGGTGKTPFVEYLVRLLSENYRIAVLSRGYKRTTKGFRFVDSDVTPGEAGDEPYQIKRKFDNIVVAVDTDRIRGIANIRGKYPDTQVILLDDAFQYRKIRPNLSIILVDYHRPLYHDSMLPGGRLREWSYFAKRADKMVVTKAPDGITSQERLTIEQRYARIFPHQLFFTAIGYGAPLAVFPNGKIISDNDLNLYHVLLITGIAHPEPFETHIRKYAVSVQVVTFTDHHVFTEKDIAHITERWNAIPATNKILLTTEKDAVRLQQMKIPEEIANAAYYVPIEVNFIDDEEGYFFGFADEILQSSASENCDPNAYKSR